MIKIDRKRVNKTRRSREREREIEEDSKRGNGKRKGVRGYLVGRSGQCLGQIRQLGELLIASPGCDFLVKKFTEM